MEDYKNNKVLELKKEMVKVPNQTDYEINGIDTSRALFFYRKSKEKFKVIPRGSYTIVDVASNKYLRITDSSLLGEAIEFQVCYLFIKSSSSYVDPFPELERLQEHYNELYSDFDNLLQQLQSNNIVGDTMKMSYVLPQLDEGQVWVLRQGQMKAENIFDLDARLQEAFENFTRVFDNWIQTEKKPEINRYIDSEKERVLQSINQKENQSIENIDSHTVNKIAEIEAEGLAQKNIVTNEGTKQVGLVTAEGNKQVQRVIEAGNNQVANVENAGETEYNKIIATGIDAKQDKVDNRLTTSTKEVVPAINLKANSENADFTGTTKLPCATKIKVNTSPSITSSWIEFCKNTGQERGGFIELRPDTNELEIRKDIIGSTSLILQNDEVYINKSLNVKGKKMEGEVVFSGKSMAVDLNSYINKGYHKFLVNCSFFKGSYFDTSASVFFDLRGVALYKDYNKIYKHWYQSYVYFITLDSNNVLRIEINTSYEEPKTGIYSVIAYA